MQDEIRYKNLLLCYEQSLEEIALYHREVCRLNKILKGLGHSDASDRQKGCEVEFNAELYAKKYPDVLKTKLSPYEHYMKIGRLLGRK